MGPPMTDTCTPAAMRSPCVSERACSTTSMPPVSAAAGIHSEGDFLSCSGGLSSGTHVHSIDTRCGEVEESRAEPAPIMRRKDVDPSSWIWGVAPIRSKISVPTQEIETPTAATGAETRRSGAGSDSPSLSGMDAICALCSAPQKHEQEPQLLFRPPDVRPPRSLLGRGRQGIVWLSEDAYHAGLHYAVKSIEVPAAMSVPVHRLIAELQRPSPDKVTLFTTASPWVVARKAAFEREASLWQQLCCHHSFVQLHGVDSVEDEKSTVYRFFMEYMSCGSLSSFVHQHYDGGRLCEQSLRWFLKPILHCMRYMHERHVVHLDIKADNIFVTWTDEHGRCGVHSNSLNRRPVTKLGDFGCAQHLPTGFSTEGRGGNTTTSSSSSRYDRKGATKRQDTDVLYGTPGFIAPEIIRHFHDSGDAYGTAADVWSFGCTVLQLLRGSPPVRPDANVAAILFETALHPERIQQFVPPTALNANAACNGTITTSKGLSTVHVEEITISASLRDMLLHCLHPDPRERPTAAQLLQHPFFQHECGPEDAAVGARDPHAIFPSGVVSAGVNNTSITTNMLGSTVSTLLDGISSSEDDDSRDDAMFHVIC